MEKQRKKIHTDAVSGGGPQKAADMEGAVCKSSQGMLGK